MTIKTIVFDLDGTLLDTLHDLADAGNYVCAQNGWPQHPVEAYRRFVGDGIPKLVERFTPPPCRTQAQLAAALAAFSQRYSAHKQDKTAPYPGIVPLLAALRSEGIACAVLSNKADALVPPILTHYFGPDAFVLARGSLPGARPKPDPAGLLALLAELRADPAATLYAGDSDVDVYTGHNAGLPVAGCCWGFRGEEELRAAGADHLLRAPEDLLSLLHEGR